MTITEEAPARVKRNKAPAGNGIEGRAKSRKLSIRPRGSVITALDVGTTKVCCFIAEVEDDKPRVLVIGHQVSRGLRNGSIIDLETAGASVLNAVHAAEEM